MEDGCSFFSSPPLLPLHSRVFRARDTFTIACDRENFILSARELTLIITADELESFNLKPYPNQLYELTISYGNLTFREVEASA